MNEAWHAFLQSGYSVLWTLRVSRYKVSKWSGCYPGIVILLTVMARSGFVSYPIPVFKAEAISKNHDKLINYTVRVSKSDVVFLSLCRICLEGRIPSFFLIFGQYPGLENS